MHDQLVTGRRLRILTVVDAVTRECLAAVVDTSISGKRVARELGALVARRGKPGLIVSDHVLCRRQHGERGREVSSRRSFPARLPA